MKISMFLDFNLNRNGVGSYFNDLAKFYTEKKNEVKIYTLQVAAFTSSRQANELINSLRKKGVRDVYKVKTKRNSGETWYKIRLGRFKSNKSARRFANQLIHQKSIKNYFVISLPVN